MSTAPSLRRAPARDRLGQCKAIQPTKLKIERTLRTGMDSPLPLSLRAMLTSPVEFVENQISVLIVRNSDRFDTRRHEAAGERPQIGQQGFVAARNPSARARRTIQAIGVQFGLPQGRRSKR